MTILRPTYFHHLDGLRAIAALAVILFHIDHWLGIQNSFLSLILSFNHFGGRLGVQFFFILSGFLITYLLFTEQARHRSINIPLFYARRILRIWPIYFLTLIIGFVVYPLIMKMQGIPYHENASFIMYALFLANFDYIYSGAASNGMLGIQWTVAAEEQFYLLWPLLFFLFSKKKYFPILLIALIIATEQFYLTHQQTDFGKYHFFSSFRFLAWGCLLGYISFHKQETMQRLLGYIRKPAMVLIYIASLSMVFFKYSIPYMHLNEAMVFLFFGFVIIEQNYSPHSFYKIGNFRILTWLGKISYGLYLYHMIAIYLVIGTVKKFQWHHAINGLLALSLTILISHFSYYYFEKYFLAIKKNKFTVKG